MSEQNLLAAKLVEVSARLAEVEHLLGNAVTVGREAEAGAARIAAALHTQNQLVLRVVTALERMADRIAPARSEE